MNKLSKMEFASHDKAVDLDALCQEIRERACTGEFDNQAYVSQDIIEKLKQIGVYRALVPKRFGGEEWSPRQFCELIETLSKAEGSVGWVASFGMSPAYLGRLPDETLKELYHNGPDGVKGHTTLTNVLVVLEYHWYSHDFALFHYVLEE